MIHWKSDFREFLFSNIHYQQIEPNNRVAEVLPKLQNEMEINILKKIHSVKKKNIKYLSLDKNGEVFYRNAGGRYWRMVKSFPSYFESSKGISTSSTEKVMSVNKEYVGVLVALYSSSLFYWFWRVVSNCRHLTDREFDSFEIPDFVINNSKVKLTLENIAKRYEVSLKENAVRVTTENKNSGGIEQDVYRIKLSKPIIDEIDKVLALHYGFSGEELDFILNYDIKYRLGAVSGDEEE